MTNQRVIWLDAGDPAESFPSPASALLEPNGLLAAGGDLSETRLLSAYAQGIFPWYEEGQPVLWWSPDPRCLFLPGDFHVARRLQRELRQVSAEIRVNSAFSEVLRQCAAPRRSGEGTWITPEMMQAYQQLHQRGWAHSVEVWEDNQLIGGLYGLAIGRAFFGESMFSRATNASKLALLFLNQRLSCGDFELLDCQVESGHLLRLGARLMPRNSFLEILESACNPPRPYTNWPTAPVPCGTLGDH